MIWIAEYITSMGIFWKFPSLVPSGLQIWLFCFVLQYNVCVSKFFNVDGCQHVLDEFGLFSTDGRRDIRILWNSNKIEAAHIQTKGKIEWSEQGNRKNPGRTKLTCLGKIFWRQNKWDINIHEKYSEYELILHILDNYWAFCLCVYSAEIKYNYMKIK